MNRTNSLTVAIAPIVLLSAAASVAQDGRWIEPRCEVLPMAKELQGQIVQLGDGSLMTVEGGNPIFDKEKRFGTIRISKDDGRTWSEPQTIYDGPEPGIPSDAGVLVRTRNGALVLVYMDLSTYKWGWDNAKGEPHDDVRLDVWSIRSLDDGKTWEDRQKIFDGYCGALINMIQTTSGRLVVPVQRLLRGPGRHAMCAYISDDDGKTWKHSNIIDLGGAGHHGGAMEGTVAELHDGRLLMLIRTVWGRFWEAYSEDQGLSWRTIGPSSIPACSAPGYLIRLVSGRLALVWNPDKMGRQELSIAFLKSDGRTWTDAIAIARDEGQQIAYPHVFERRPGELWVMNRWPPGRPPLRLRLRETDFATVPAPVRIVAFGDSTTAFRSSIKKVYSQRVAEALPAHGISAWVVNSGVGSSTTREARSRFERDVLAHRPEVVIIMLGANDSAIDVWKNPPATQSRVSREEYGENLSYFCKTLKTQGAKVILMTPTPFRWTLKLKELYGKRPYDVDDPNGFSAPLAEYCEIMRKVAREEEVTLIDLFQAFQGYDRVDGQRVEDLLLDGMHPNDLGHELVTDLLVPEILKVTPGDVPDTRRSGK